MQKLSGPFGNYQLQRLPIGSNNTKSQPLRAWDAADELLLKQLHQHSLLRADSRILLVNDSFAALACSLNSFNLTSWNDSRLSQLACRHNARINSLQLSLTEINSTDCPEGEFDFILIKAPKNNALLEHQLAILAKHANSNTIFITAVMVKYFQKSQLNLFEKYIGKTTTSLAVKKARLIFSQTDNIVKTSPSPYPKFYDIDELGLNICHHANVFSRDKLDIGTRFMLQQFDQLPIANKIVDLGCGNGILGIMAQQKFVDSKVYFIDESHMAVASAKASYRLNIHNDLKNNDNVDERFIVSDCFQQTELNDADLILCNPPFHHNNVVGDQIAWSMFKQSQQRLANNGTLWVVANRHLNYHAKIKQLFGHCRLLASNKKFVILAAIKKST